MRKLTTLMLICFLFVQTAVCSAGASSWGSIEPRGRNTATLYNNPQAIDRISRELALAKYNNRISQPPVMRLATEDDQRAHQKRGWIARHPVIFGAIVGFAVGFPVGYATGNSAARGDPSSDYLTPEEKGLLIGGIGAGIGALIGKLVF